MPVEATLESRNETEQTRSGQFYRPDVDILELADELVVHADVPGARSEDVDINFEDGALTIFAKVAERPASGPVLAREYGVGDFRRTFRVSEQIDASRISAQYQNGVLTLHLPKAERARPRKIQVQG
jgi:HSP20 family molecular chaperone IbpA